MSISTRTALALALAAVLAFGVIGCAAPQEPATGEDPAAEATTVKIGFAAPLTGDNAVYGQGMQRAVQLAIDEANASEEAKAKGMTFEIRAGDDAGDPKQAVNVANALAGDDSVIGVVGHFNSGCSIPAAPVYEAVKLAMVTVSSNPQLTATGLTNVNRIVAKDDAQGGFAATLANELGFKTVAVIDDATPYGQGLAGEFEKAFRGAGGEVVATERIQPKEVDFSALVTKIKGLAPDAVYYAGAHTEGALITKQMKEAGLNVPVMGGDMLFTPEYIKIAGAKNAEGDIATALGLPLEQQPKGAEFLAKYEEKFGAAPEAYDSYAYDAARIIINAALATDANRFNTLDAIRTGTLADGVTGVVEFDSNGDNKQQIISAYRVEGGEWKQILK
ncbi:MAG: branched-chain amino acid ABC transporter substrate-binding protein [Coriobacteriia bacterium]|nr:branched-chain amino acid ABC transporter substrate-binding protein [Coriobacteriia bacterium]